MNNLNLSQDVLRARISLITSMNRANGAAREYSYRIHQ